MKLSIYSVWAVISLISFSIVNCSKASTDNSVGQFPAQIVQFPEGVTPSNPTQEISGVDAVTPQGIIARKSAWLRYHTQINTNVYVLGNCTGIGCLDPATPPSNPKHINNANSELTVGVGVSVPAGRVLKADKIRLKNRANVQGATEANTYAKHPSATIATQVNNLGALPRLPFFLSGTPGTQSVNDATAVLAPGQYHNLTVRRGKTITLAGGYYQLHDIDLKKESSVICQTQCFVTVKADIVSEKKITLAAASANPNDFLIYVEGGNMNAEPMAASSKAVQLGGLSQITANIYAPNGRLQFGMATVAKGAFIGNHVRIEPNSVVTAGPAPVGVVKLFEAGEPGSIEIAGKVKLDVPAGALSEDTVISVANRGPITADKPRSPAQLRFAGDALEFQPDGLTFAQNYTLTMNYDPAQVSAIGVTANDIRVFSAPSNSAAYTASPTTLVAANNQLVASDNHFTFFTVGSTGVSQNVAAMSVSKHRIFAAIDRGQAGPSNFRRYTLYPYDITNKATAPILLPVAPGVEREVVNVQSGIFISHPEGALLSAYNAPLNYFTTSRSAGLDENFAQCHIAFWNMPVSDAAIGYASGVEYLIASGPTIDYFNGQETGFMISVKHFSSPATGSICPVMTGSNLVFLSATKTATFTAVNEKFVGNQHALPYGLHIHSDILNTANNTEYDLLPGQYVIISKRKGNHVILGTWANGQPTIRAFDPYTNQLYAHSTGSPNTTQGLAVTGNVVYALQTGGSGAIAELDMTNPALPQPPLSSIAVAPDTFQMSQSGNYLVVAEGTFSTPSLRLINIGFPVRGTVTGLPSGGTVELVNNVTTGQPPKTVINGNGSYQNAELIADGNSYNFVVASQPPGYTCTVTGGSGVMDFHSTPVNVDVGCVPAGGWVQKGAALNTMPYHYVGEPTVASDGISAYVAWDEYYPNTPVFQRQVFVKKWDGTSWHLMGGALNAAATNAATNARIVLVNGTPYVTWLEFSAGIPQVFVAHWNGTAWVADGGSLNISPAKPARSLSAAVVNGKLHVTWVEPDSANFPVVRIKKLDAGYWQSLPTRNSIYGDPADQPVLSEGFNGQLVLAVNQSSSIFADFYDGANWQYPTADSMNSQWGGWFPKVYRQGAGVRAAFWEFSGAQLVLQHRQWTGSSWGLLGAPLVINTGIGPQDYGIAANNAGVYLAYKENTGDFGRVYVRYFDGSMWQPLGGVLNFDVTESAVSVKSIATVQGRPFVAWSERTNAGTGISIYVKAYE